ncbi:MAG: putative dehydrogenase [Algoriphagus sp.]|jgi:predicted dehydrogenase
MKILLKGFGSIGRRHCENLLLLGYDNIVIVSSKTELGEKFKDIPTYIDLNKALADHVFTHGFICSPTAFHTSDLRQFLNAEIPAIYLEKPVSHSLDAIEELLELAKNKTNVVVGFDLHFDPGLTMVKEIIDSNQIGKIYSANSFVGQYLPDWRPYEDYRVGMSASKEKGGGVMLDLVHEFDYLRWLLGKPRKVASFYQTNSQLEIETEDLADVLIQFENGINGSIHLDYHQRKLIRFCIITGERGTIKWDLAARKVILTHHDHSIEEFEFSNFERNDRYLQVLDAFFNNPGDVRLTSFEDGIISLKMVLAAKMASEQERVIEIKAK